jgi:hypothetical protein
MTQFIELPVAADDDESEAKKQVINLANVGRVYASPQNSRKSMMELNYHSINDAPVLLEIELPYETLRTYFIS